MSAAESGHLVLSTLHALNATETINRMIDLFPPHERVPVRTMLAGISNGIIGQRLLRAKDSKGRVAACEAIGSTGRTREFIMDLHQSRQMKTTALSN